MPEKLSSRVLSEIVLERIRAEENPATRFGMLCGPLIGTTVGGFTDEEWNAMGATAIEPCAAKDCTCERLRGPLFAALDALRADYIEKTSYSDLDYDPEN